MAAQSLETEKQDDVYYKIKCMLQGTKLLDYVTAADAMERMFGISCIGFNFLFLLEILQ